jgi:hypothetical protein
MDDEWKSLFLTFKTFQMSNMNEEMTKRGEGNKERRAY